MIPHPPVNRGISGTAKVQNYIGLAVIVPDADRGRYSDPHGQIDWSNSSPLVPLKNVLAPLNTDVMVRPPTICVSKVTVTSEKYTNILMGTCSMQRRWAFFPKTKGR